MEKNIYITKGLCFQARRASRVLTQIYDSFIKKAGLRSSQYSLLVCIDNLREPNISVIGTMVSMDQTTVSRNVAKLKKHGLIETYALPDAPHKARFRLTPLGHEKLENARSGWENAQAFVKSRLGEDFEQISDLLNRLAEVLDYKV